MISVLFFFFLSTLSRWWFQTFFNFIPTWGRFPILLIFFKGVETTNQMTLNFSRHEMPIFSKCFDQAHAVPKNMTVHESSPGGCFLYGTTDKGNGKVSIETGVLGQWKFHSFVPKDQKPGRFFARGLCDWAGTLKESKIALGVAKTLQTKWVNTNFHEGNPLLTFISTLWTFCSQYAYADWQQGKSHCERMFGQGPSNAHSVVVATFTKKPSKHETPEARSVYRCATQGCSHNTWFTKKSNQGNHSECGMLLGGSSA